MLRKCFAFPISNGMDINYFKNLLEKEKTEVESQLKRLARKTSKGNDWEPTPPETDIQMSEAGEVADFIEEMENRLGVEKELEGYLNEIEIALAKIEKGAFGICEKTGEKISEERLKANPIARTCVDHL